MHIDRIPVYRVYQRAIDLELYHAFAELVVQTSQDDTARRTYRQTRAMQIWQVETDVSGYFEPYHLRYPGEVLERFEEKLGNDVRVLRALALALGNTCAIQSDNMFVGNQRGAFLQKLRRSAGEDVYLQGALYLLETDAARRHDLLDELAAKVYVRTEEALFVLSLFDDREHGYEVIHTQLSHLFTQNRTLSLVYDFGVLEWFIRFYAEQAKKYRGKADLVLRTLMKLPYMNMKPDSREFSVLTKAGYRCDEIILANSLAVWADRLPDRLSSKSITAEKIATACGRMLLNAPKDLSEEFYEYLGWLFRFYNSFTVKYEGFQGLWEAVQYGLNPTAPKTLLWMNQTIQKDFPYRFDVFDPQYDDLAKELERDNYMELFTLQMLHSRQRIPLKQWLSRYQELTGADYGEYFRSWHTNGRRVFAFLVEKKEINLWEFWKKNLSLARGAFWAEEVDDFYHTLRLGELPHSTCLSYRTGSQRECLLAAFDSNKKIVLVKKDEAVVARACLRLTKGAFQKPPAVDFSFADLSQENMDSGKPVTSEKPVLFLESIYTFGLNDIEKEEVMKLAVSLTTQKAAELGVVAVLARRYLGCYERDEYVLAPFYVYISKSKNGWQYLDSLGGAAYTSAKEEYVEHPFLVIQTAMHHAGAHNRNEVDYE